MPGDAGIPGGLTQTYYKAFAPRIGIAWSPGTSGKTSVRAGCGMFYNPIEQLVLEQFSAEPPFGVSTFPVELFLTSRSWARMAYRLSESRERNSSGHATSPWIGEFFRAYFAVRAVSTAYAFAVFRPVQSDDRARAQGTT